MKTFQEANEALRQFWPDKLSRQVVYTRDSIMELLSYVGDPQEKLKIIHVAGTSGKTSTAYYAAALLRATGKEVGLTVSPHVDEINERVQINLEPLPEALFCTELTEFLGIVKKSGVEVSYFEVMVAFAFWAFVRRGMEYAVIEVGLGGLADATNVIRRPDKVCVITDIGLDHINVLGATLPEIAEQKAGIIQLHNSVFCYRQAPQIMKPIRARAEQKQADLHMLDAGAALSNLEFLPLFQQRNIGLARAAVDALLGQQHEQGLTDTAIAKAARTHIPARMETLSQDGKVLIIDGAHNAQKLHALGLSIKRKYAGKQMAGVVSFVDGRSYRLEDSTKELAALLDHIIITSFNGPQDGPHHSVDTTELEQLFRRHGAASIEVIPDPKTAFAALLKRPERLLLVAGSFYLLNHIRPLVRALYK